MDALAKIFSALVATDFLQTFVSMALAAVVFFYFVYLLRKKEVAEQADEEKNAANIGTKMRRHA